MLEKWGAVPAMPNAGKATGTVEEVAPHPQRAQDMVVRLAVEQTEDVPGLPNFVAAEAGHAIQVIVRRGQQLALVAGCRVELTVHFEGDERHGGFYANASELHIVAAGEDK